MMTPTPVPSNAVLSRSSSEPEIARMGGTYGFLRFRCNRRSSFSREGPAEDWAVLAEKSVRTRLYPSQAQDALGIQQFR